MLVKHATDPDAALWKDIPLLIDISVSLFNS